MKLAAAICALAVAAVVAVFVVVYTGNKDSTPDAVRACVADLGIPRVIGNDALGLAKVDLQRGTVRAATRTPLQGGTFATVLRPPDGAYTLLVVTRKTEPEAAVLKLVSERPEDAVLVAYTRSTPLGRALAGCAARRAA